MMRPPTRTTLSSSSAASDVYKRQGSPPKKPKHEHHTEPAVEPAAAVLVEPPRSVDFETKAVNADMFRRSEDANNDGMVTRHESEVAGKHCPDDQADLNNDGHVTRSEAAALSKTHLAKANIEGCHCGSPPKKPKHEHHTEPAVEPAAAVLVEPPRSVDFETKAVNADMFRRSEDANNDGMVLSLIHISEPTRPY
eukprot:TRINITY_DN13582_c0_g1_i2.p1 TRINITY_DN13582_c0_g1~~TRINITY_DN13582_c0_g1_i2.p1  ORF type:complete len:195 (+),score=37.79 TRINITY_DN13582_c0_g1_i2:18-602(+)